MSSRGRPRTKLPEVRRKDILGAARSVLIEKGYHQVLLDDVARRAGVAKGTLYLYFRDKEDLFANVLDDVLNGLKARIEAAERQPSAPLQGLRRVIEAELQFVDENQDFLVQFSREKPDLCGARAGEVLKRRFAKHLDFLSGKIRACVRSGDLRDHDPFLGSLMLLSLVRMFRLKKITAKEKKPLVESADLLLDLYLNGLGRKAR